MVENGQIWDHLTNTLSFKLCFNGFLFDKDNVKWAPYKNVQVLNIRNYVPRCLKKRQKKKTNAKTDLAYLKHTLFSHKGKLLLFCFFCFFSGYFSQVKNGEIMRIVKKTCQQMGPFPRVRSWAIDWLLFRQVTNEDQVKLHLNILIV